MQMQGGGLTIREMCESSTVSRASYYRNWRKQDPKQEQTALRDAIQRLALRDRHCGYRRIGRWLYREGWIVNHKRVLRLMREDNLLSIRRRRFVVTTDSAHCWRVYPNLARRMVLSAINQLWVSRYYLRSIAAGVHLPGGDSGCLLATCGGMEHQPSTRQPCGSAGFGVGPEATSTGTRADSSLRSRCSVRVRRLCEAAGGRRHHD